MSTFGKRKGGGRRRALRSQVPLIAVVTTLTDSRSAVVVDVSATGVRLRGKGLPQGGSELFVTIEGVVAFGTVAWSQRSECGVEFDTPLKAGDERLLRHKVVQANGLPAEIRAAFDDWTVGVAR